MATPDALLPNVFSISWGWSEADQCQIDKKGPCAGGKNSSGFVAATNALFAAVTARGVSFLVSSGDSGAHGRTDGGCAKPMPLPDWPTASPGVTAVGATQVADGTCTIEVRNDSGDGTIVLVPVVAGVGDSFTHQQRERAPAPR